MNKSNHIKLNFIPSYSHNVKIIGAIFLLISIFYTLFSMIFQWSYISMEITNWLIALSLLIISFSKDKVNSQDLILLKYYAGKITSSFIFSFILSMKLAELIGDFKLPIDNIVLVIIALALYQIIYNIIKYAGKGKNIKLNEESVYKTFLNNKKLFLISVILAIITLIIIIMMK